MMSDEMRRWGLDNHDAVMDAIDERHDYVMAEMDRRFRWALAALIMSGIVGVVGAATVTAWVIVAGVLLLAVSMAVWRRTSNPDRLRNGWNDENGAVGAYLASHDQESTEQEAMRRARRKASR